MDEWTCGNGISLTNFFVNSPSEIIFFLEPINTLKIEKRCTKIFDLLNDIVEDIWEKHVVQVITDKTSNYVIVGKTLEEKSKKLV